jgi:phosphoribosylformylglycinamidine synthase
MEKLLMEACLEVMKTGAVIGIQDMGAAGLTCSTAEMGARAGMGVEIDIARVPKRETGMTAYEVMLSESQERMLLVAEKGREQDVVRVFDKWDLHAEAIGTVTADGRLRVLNQGRPEAEVPTTALTDAAPVYERPWVDPVNPAAAEDVLALPATDAAQALPRVLASPNVACKRWVYRQYDSTVRTNTVAGPGSDAAVVRVKGTRKALALSLDGNGRYCWLDPYRGAQLAVAEACRNVACAGAVPIGATNCLNFGNPEKPEVMGQFARAVQGMGDACRALGVPITGGNVSLYNETDGRAIHPTPVMGVVGLIEEAEGVLRRWFSAEGDAVYLLGVTGADLGGSEWLSVMHGRAAGAPPRRGLASAKALDALLAEAASERLLRSAHDLSDGGLAVALAECCFAGEEAGLGGRFELDEMPLDSTGGGEALARGDVLLFSETPSRAVVSVRDEPRLRELAAHHGVRWSRLGETGGDRLAITRAGRGLVDAPVTELHAAWMGLEKLLAG